MTIDVDAMEHSARNASWPCNTPHGWVPVRDAIFLATARPEVVLALIDRVRATDGLETKLSLCSEACDKNEQALELCVQQRDQARKRRA